MATAVPVDPTTSAAKLSVERDSVSVIVKKIVSETAVPPVVACLCFRSGFLVTAFGLFAAYEFGVLVAFGVLVVIGLVLLYTEVKLNPTTSGA